MTTRLSTLRLDEINIGKIDGKDEFFRQKINQNDAALEYFFMPENISDKKFLDRKSYFLVGRRGTGKTTYLRWLASRQNQLGIVNFILFKSSLTEELRVEISKMAGYSVAEISSQKFEFSQDFKESWKWFLLYQVAKSVKENQKYVTDDPIYRKCLSYAGLSEGLFEKVFGYFPALKSGKIKLAADAGSIKGEIEATLEPNSHTVPLYSFNELFLQKVVALDIQKPIYIFVDELEVFFHSVEQYRRDLRLCRDLLFQIKHLNDMFEAKKANIFIFAAVRNEVLDAIGTDGQEVDRLVYDFSQPISWHAGKKGLDHPLLKLIEKKIIVSEQKNRIEAGGSIWSRYFPQKIYGASIETFLLDHSFYKPRDLIWRLTLCQKMSPNSLQFSQELLEATYSEYSQRMWDEIEQGLVPLYSRDEIQFIKDIFSGKCAFFEFGEIEERVQSAKKDSSVAEGLLARRDLRLVLHDLYLFGALGNEYKEGRRTINRWIFRGERELLLGKTMVLHRALWRHFSAFKQRPKAHFRRGRHFGRHFGA